MKEASFECWLKINFENDYDVNEITKSIDIEPYYAKRYSESGYTRLGVKKSGYWDYCNSNHYVDSMSLNEILTEFLQPFTNEKVNAIREIAEKNQGKVVLLINIYFNHGWFPEMIFGENVMKIIHALNADIEFNINENSLNEDDLCESEVI